MFACSSGRAPVLEKELLFRLQYGLMEDQLDLYFHDGISEDTTRLAMRGGLFYLSTAGSNKVMEFTSYGDILTLYYHPSGIHSLFFCNQLPQRAETTPVEPTSTSSIISVRSR